MPSPADFPARLGRYLIERVLGRGAMGVVYLAFDPHIERQVALKTIRSELLTQTAPKRPDDSAHDLTARFLNEARAAGRLVHPHIVSVYDYGETGDTAFITMEYVRGESLAARLAQHRARRHAHGAPRASAAGSCNCSTRSTTRTTRASFIATSSRPICSSRNAANARSRTSASRISTRRT